MAERQQRAKVTKHSRVYLSDTDLIRHSAHHTAYVGDGDGNIRSMVFKRGVARNVPEQEYQLFKANGVATNKRPVLGDDDF